MTQVLERTRYGRASVASVFAKQRRLDRCVEKMADYGIMTIGDLTAVRESDLFNAIRTTQSNRRLIKSTLRQLGLGLAS